MDALEAGLAQRFENMELRLTTSERQQKESMDYLEEKLMQLEREQQRMRPSAATSAASQGLPKELKPIIGGLPRDTTRERIDVLVRKALAQSETRARALPFGPLS